MHIAAGSMPGRTRRYGRWRLPLVAVGALLIAACASAPLDSTGVATDITPEQVRTDPESARDETVIWGGRIVASKNLEDRTRLEVVSYPLAARSQRPQSDRQPGPRFLIYHDGYLETAQYAPGRDISVRGRVGDTERGRIGEADYTYPVVHADQLHLWSEQASAPDSGPRINFGVGVIFSR